MGQNTFLEVSSTYFHMHWPSTWADEFNALPANLQQLQVLGERAGVPVYAPFPGSGVGVLRADHLRDGQRRALALDADLHRLEAGIGVDADDGGVDVAAIGTVYGDYSVPVLGRVIGIRSFHAGD